MNTPANFLGLPAENSSYQEAEVFVLPLGLEATVSYGAGTSAGPDAIIAASQQVELYDREFDCEPALGYGIHTLPAPILPDTPEQAVDLIAATVADAASTGKLVVGLGGEHTVSLGFGRGLLRAHDGPITIVQIDAHSDLRETYDGTRFSHACVARRLLEDERIDRILQLGIRSLCTEEVSYARQHADRVRIWYAEDIHGGRWQNEFIKAIDGRSVYVTVDVDGLDPAIVPATGTPEPDGLNWSESLHILMLIAQSSHIIGMDFVELAPVPYLHAADFAVAKLVYKAITYAMTFGR